MFSLKKKLLLKINDTQLKSTENKLIIKGFTLIKGDTRTGGGNSAAPLAMLFFE